MMIIHNTFRRTSQDLVTVTAILPVPVVMVTQFSFIINVPGRPLLMPSALAY